MRVVDGALRSGEPLRLLAAGRRFEPLECGTFGPELTALPGLTTGEVGYVATGLKEVAEVRVGDTLTSAVGPATAPLPGYSEAKPMVFAGLYPTQAADYAPLGAALAKLQLSDSSLQYQAESSAALGFGYRMGFLGLLHMEIVRERLTLYLAEIRHVRPLLNGNDLMALGVPEGPRVGELLAEVLNARLDGLLSTRDDEERLVLRRLE